ncbi:iron ABC transporter substrate-binding protein [Lysinibacillus sp. 2017]|nr:iron ABC transporter substrate-binding protein [Lysinibacillus sp. 2017]TGN34702.1 extracellular solute-binding protein [Lysinibacillus sp. S2017]
MKAFTLLISLTILSVVFLAACSDDSDSSSGDKNVLTVYSARSENLNNLVISNFEKETGIKVELIVAGTGELLKRVESEKNNPLGDVLWAADETMLSTSKEFFEQYVSPEDKNMIEQFRNKSGYFTPAFSDPTVLIVNTDLIGDKKMDSFEDLLNPELKGKIAFGDPVNSSSAFQSLAAMLYAMGDGDPMSDKAWDFVEKFIKNLDGKMIASSGQLHKSVADGEYPVGLTWEDPVVNYINNGAPVEVVFPTEGAIFPGESVQIVKNAKNLENAKKFVDFMISEDIQTQVGQELTVRPLRDGVELASYMTPTESIKIAKNYEESWVAENKDAITAKFTDYLERSMD